MKLTERKIRSLKPGNKAKRYPDGFLSLSLVVKPSGRRYFTQYLRIDGRQSMLSIGPWPDVSLEEARDKAIENRRMVATGGDPRSDKAMKAVTVADAMEAVIGIQRGAWKDGGKSEKQWRHGFETYAPRLLNRPAGTVEASEILACLSPIWNVKRETARKLKMRIGMVMKYAIAEGLRTDNPVQAISAALPKSGAKVKHHPALPFAEVGVALETVEATGAWWATKAAFRFLVLTASRSGEVREMRWNEVDGDVWTIPAERAKLKRAHRVPLSGEALAVLDQARQYSDGSGLVFPSARGKAMTDSTISKLVRENGIKAVPHGFRSSFRDWAAEKTNFPREIAEFAISHVEGSDTERAYRRTDYFDKRADLMETWAQFVTAKPGKVVAIRA